MAPGSLSFDDDAESPDVHDVILANQFVRDVAEDVDRPQRDVLW